MDSHTIVPFVHHVLKAESLETPPFSIDEQTCSPLHSAASPCIRLQLHQLGVKLDISALPEANNLGNHSSASSARISTILSLDTPGLSPLPATQTAVGKGRHLVTSRDNYAQLVRRSPPPPQFDVLSEEDVFSELTSLFSTYHEGAGRTAFMNRLNTVLRDEGLQVSPLNAGQNFASNQEVDEPGLPVGYPEDAEVDHGASLNNEDTLLYDEKYGENWGHYKSKHGDETLFTVTEMRDIVHSAVRRCVQRAIDLYDDQRNAGEVDLDVIAEDAARLRLD
jgi:hypothetical protein